MHSLRVALGERSYTVHVGAGALERTDLLDARLAAGRVALVTNTVVAPLYAHRVEAAFARTGATVLRITLPDGEAHKTWQSLDLIHDQMLAARCDRHTTIVALGGGVVGDVAGFAAATFMRGIDYVQVPTTLLSQVDSSVGGKTAINHPRGKNMVGAFHQPVAVLADPLTLDTLRPRELAAGLAEVIKHGLLADIVLFEWLEQHMERLVARDPEALAHVIRRSVEIKGAIVAEDEHETGVRALLNLGHTFGHAIEAGLGFGTWLHGEAVGAGLVMAAELSRSLGYLGAADVARVRDLVGRARLPVAGPALGVDRYFELMSVDKKARNGALRFIALERLGVACISDGTPRASIVEAIEAGTC